jgi:hypothetical protein
VVVCRLECSLGNALETTAPEPSRYKLYIELNTGPTREKYQYVMGVFNRPFIRKLYRDEGLSNIWQWRASSSLRKHTSLRRRRPLNKIDSYIGNERMESFS